MPTQRPFVHALAGLAAIAALIGCANPEGEYQEFINRYEVINPASSSSSVGGGCAAPAGGEADGDYYFALSPSFSAKTPLVFLATVSTSDGANGLDINMSLQPLNAEDRMTAEGSPIVFDVTAGMDGVFMTAPANIAVVSAANPISDSAVEAENVTLAGALCAQMDVVCGAVGGNVTVPAPLPLDNSTFSMQRVTGPADYPEPPPINCAGDLADPLGM